MVPASVNAYAASSMCLAAGGPSAITIRPGQRIKNDQLQN